MPMRRNIDIDLLRTFATIVEVGSFTRAAERLLRTQSAISLQVKRLEELVGSPVFDRSGRGPSLTGTGEMLRGYAARILDANDALVARLCEPEVEGRVRLGTPEDFATAHLPVVLARFARAFPRVSMEVTCDLTLNLLDRFEGGEFDVVLAKREPSGGSPGIAVWREPLVWAGADPELALTADALPLAVSPAPCVYRKRATTALDHAGRPWRIAYTSPSLAGVQAAVSAGLAVTVVPREMVGQGMRVLGGESGLPDLPDTEIAMLRRSDLSPAAARLADFVVAALEQGR